MICLMFDNWIAWLIPYLIAKNYASVEVILITWWRVLMIGLLWMWIWAIKVTTWFLILTSKTTTAILESVDIWNIILLSLWMCTFLPSLLIWIGEWNEKQLEKILINLDLEENSELKELNEGKILFNLLFVLTTEHLVFNHCWDVKFLSNI